jgi:tRNA uridine 5-carbamoylmethylation protein Kti12
MILLLNGAFGIGKTTVARELLRRLNGSATFDPEWAGSALRLFSPRVDDYQDLPVWRRLTIVGVRAMRALHPMVIVPMAFTNLNYLEEIRRGVSRADPEVRHFCLVAPLHVVMDRLARRAKSPPSAWQLRRAEDCCAVHGEPPFAEQVSAAGREPGEIAADIVDRLSVA